MAVDQHLDWYKDLLKLCRREEDKEVINFAILNYDIILIFCKFNHVILDSIHITDKKIQFEGRKLEISEK